MGEQKEREIVDGEAQLVAVTAGLAFQLAASGGAYAGIVDQKLQPVVFRPDRLSQPWYLIKRGEIGLVIFEPVIVRLIADRVRRGGRTLQRKRRKNEGADSGRQGLFPPP